MAAQNYTPPKVDPNGDSVRQRIPWPIQASSNQRSTGAAQNAAASVAIQVDATTAPSIDGATNTGGINTPVPNIVGQVWWSYNGSTNPGNLTITGATVGTVFDQDVSGAGNMPFNPPLVFNPGEAVTITLGALAAATGKVGCVAWKLK